MIGKVNTWPLYNSTLIEWNVTATINSTSCLNIFGPWISAIAARYTAISFAVVGGIGGFLSGLLQMRDSKTDLGEYEVSILLFQIRPIFGAFAALVSFMLLSWNVLSGVINPTTGSYALIAFVSGFSERYFIRLFDKMNGDTELPNIPSKEEVASEIRKAEQTEAVSDGEKKPDLN